MHCILITIIIAIAHLYAYVPLQAGDDVSPKITAAHKDRQTEKENCEFCGEEDERKDKSENKSDRMS